MTKMTMHPIAQWLTAAGHPPKDQNETLEAGLNIARLAAEAIGISNAVAVTHIRRSGPVIDIDISDVISGGIPDILHHVLRRIGFTSGISSATLSDMEAWWLATDQSSSFFAQWLLMLLYRQPAGHLCAATISGVRDYGARLSAKLSEAESFFPVDEAKKQILSRYGECSDDSIGDLAGRLFAFPDHNSRMAEILDLDPEKVWMPMAQPAILLRYELYLRQNVAGWLDQMTERYVRISPEQVGLLRGSLVG